MSEAGGARDEESHEAYCKHYSVVVEGEGQRLTIGFGKIHAVHALHGSSFGENTNL